MSSRLLLISLPVLVSLGAGCSAAGGGPAGSGLSDSEESGADPGSGSGDSGTSSGSGGPSGSVIDTSKTMNEDGGDACDSVLEVTYRDFNEQHPDFEMPFRGDVVRRGLIQPTLGPGQKPVFLSSVGCPADMATPLGCADWTVTEPVISSADSFAQWYTTSDVNQEIPGTIALTETAPGSGQYVYESAEFFPLGASDGFGLTPAGHYMGKNFLFTTEIHLMFEYRAGQTFSFRGDDDLWIFVNGKLAMDLGSMHGPEQGTIDFDAQAADLGISPGNSYPMDIFHAERHTDGSNFKFETNISCFTPVVVK